VIIQILKFQILGSINKYSDQFAFTSYSGVVEYSNLKNITEKSENLKENCASSSSYEIYQKNKLRKKLNDQEKNDIILVEDEIYNLAFTPIKM
jgi:hypothetical protein